LKEILPSGEVVRRASWGLLEVVGDKNPHLPRWIGDYNLPLGRNFTTKFFPREAKRSPDSSGEGSCSSAAPAPPSPVSPVKLRGRTTGRGCWELLEVVGDKTPTYPRSTAGENNLPLGRNFTTKFFPREAKRSPDSSGGGSCSQS